MPDYNMDTKTLTEEEIELFNSIQNNDGAWYYMDDAVHAYEEADHEGRSIYRCIMCHGQVGPMGGDFCPRKECRTVIQAYLTLMELVAGPKMMLWYQETAWEEIRDSVWKLDEDAIDRRKPWEEEEE